MNNQSVADRHIPKVNFDQLFTLILIADYSKRPLITRGDPGSGKTEATRAYVRAQRTALMSDPVKLKKILDAIPAGSPLSKRPIEEQVFGYIDFRLTYFDPTDLKGFPLLDKELGISSWLPPGTLPLKKLVDAGIIPARGLWGLEELANATRATLAATFQPVLDRSVAGEPIAEGWCIVATSNSLEHMSVVNPLPAPLVSRFSHCELHSTTGEWCDWAMNPSITVKHAHMIPNIEFPPAGSSLSGNIHDKLVSYFKFKAEDLHGFNPKNWVQDTPYCCPRSVEMLSDAMYSWEAIYRNDRFPLHLITSFIGTTVGNQLYAYLDIFKDLPSVAEVIADPMGAKLPRETSAIYAICTALARKADRENLDSLYAYFSRFEKAFEIAAVKDVNRCHPALASHPAFGKHVLKPENSEIYTELASGNN